MTTTDLARLAGRTRTPAKSAAARRNGRAGRQSKRPEVIAAARFARTRRVPPVAGDWVTVRETPDGWGLLAIGTPVYDPRPGDVAVPVGGGWLERYAGPRWVTLRHRCGPLLRPTDADTTGASPRFLRDMALQAHDIAGAGNVHQLARALQAAADEIERLAK